MGLSVGVSMWLPCKVRPGPFSDERMILVTTDSNNDSETDGSNDSEWLGFVNVQWLKNRCSEGRDEVLARVVDVDGAIFRARIPGEALRNSLVEGRVVDHVAPGDPVQA